MEPIRLELRNFTAFADSVIDLDPLRLAALVGQNGAGKSSILDGILFCLFGESTKGGAKSIDNHVRRGETECRVTLDFYVGDSLYRVTRHRTLGKKTLLELYRRCLTAAPNGGYDPAGDWRPLSAKNVTDTQAMIEDLLRMDYRTFTATSLILQGKSDSLTADMTDQERKEVLARILGLDLWDRLQDAAREKGKAAKINAGVIRARMESAQERAGAAGDLSGQIITAERRLHDVATALTDQAALVSELEARAGQEPILRQQLQGLNSQAIALVDEKTRTIQAMDEAVSEIANLKRTMHRPATVEYTLPEAEERVEVAAADRHAQAAMVERLVAESWELSHARTLMTEIREDSERRRAERSKRAHRMAELQTQLRAQEALLAQGAQIREAVHKLPALIAEADQWTAKKAEDADLERLQVSCRADYRTWEAEHRGQLAQVQSRLAGCKQGARLVGEVPCSGTDLPTRCPLMADAVTAAEALPGLEAELATIEADTNPYMATGMELQQKRTALGYNASTHLWALKAVEDSRSLANQVAALEVAENRAAELRQAMQELGKIDLEDAERLVILEAQYGEHSGTVRRLAEAENQLPVVRQRLKVAEGAEQAAREHLARVQQSLEDARRQATEAEVRLPDLEARRDAADQRRQEIDREIVRLGAQRSELEMQIAQVRAAQQQLQEARASLSLARAEESQLREELGRLRQRLADAEQAAQEAEQLRSELATAERRVMVYEILDQACGKKAGVPALIVEAAVPQIETIANDVLGRMAGGRLAVRLDTQAETKTGSMSEVLRITVLDGGVEGPYQTYSGAERFMVDLSLRIALTKFLANRAGAEISLLVLDEGLGAADGPNRAAIIQAITEAANYFRKVLVVTHIAELQEALPQRVEVTRAPGGSTVKVIA